MDTWTLFQVFISAHHIYEYKNTSLQMEDCKKVCLVPKIIQEVKARKQLRSWVFHVLAFYVALIVSYRMFRIGMNHI